MPEPLGYRVKNRLLGPPLHNDQLAHERLGKPTALAVFASDNLSSSAYATEEILRVAHPRRSASLAFSLVLPITVAMLVVLVLPDPLATARPSRPTRSAGGAYIVTKDNFGLLPAQVAGVALLTDYILTVAGVGGGRRRPPSSRRSPVARAVHVLDSPRLHRASSPSATSGG